MAADEAGIMKDEVAGRLAERMALERREEVRDALGGSAAVWAQEAVLWAAVVPDRGGVEQSGDARRGDRRWAVTIRRRGGLGLDCRFRWGGRVLRVRFVEDDPRVGDLVTVRCEERSEEHTSELQSLMRSSYAVFGLKQKQDH